MTHPTLHTMLTLAATMRQELARCAPQTPEEFVVHTHVAEALTALEKRLARSPVRKGRPRSATSIEKRAQVREWRGCGMSAPEIAGKLGISEASVYRALED